MKMLIEMKVEFIVFLLQQIERQIRIRIIT